MFTTGVDEHGSTSSDQLVARVDAYNAGIHIQSTTSAPTDSSCDDVDSVELDAVAFDAVSIPNLPMANSFEPDQVGTTQTNSNIDKTICFLIFLQFETSVNIFIYFI
ncbi:uncharacterized protein LOC124311878 [Daphnia pulicaria]|uniref:uncharacterized protein LOC124311878 n=1 Tax=Daphnia pulicaria TaxID=35523 RepID=UPI001EEB48F0|nr:uncharacterized protein LOC124311878 [Daphnia pulicaria]